MHIDVPRGKPVFDTNIVIVGNVLTAPEWRRTNTSNSLVANFRIASTSRKFDRDAGRWVDGNTIRVRVTAWRKLAEGVASSVAVGDPVIVYGRIFTRDWVDDEKKPRVSYEMEALSIGHDLGRGRGRFFRNRPAPSTSVIEGPEDDAIVRGEPAVAVDEAEAPVGYGDGLPERAPDEVAPAFAEVVAGIEEETGESSAEETSPEPSEGRRSRRSGRREPVPA
jgi:single-strand DNA-binding protein